MVIHLILGQRVPLLVGVGAPINRGQVPLQIHRYPVLEIWVGAPINRVVTDKGWYESPF